MNGEELAANKAYSKWKVYDLNASVDQKWDIVEAGTLDLVICTVSIDYLIHPLEVLKECHRLMKSGTFILFLTLSPLLSLFHLFHLAKADGRCDNPSHDFQSLFCDKSYCNMVAPRASRASRVGRKLPTFLWVRGYRGC
jgi:ubiquinone/menaquinone biosynthesis C-methylase UbiE